jgi:membrane-bound metal-dependent hydrolase YbcI (DUF457 family)
MFLGHFALGLASKKVNARPSLGTYFLAAQFLDLLWPLFLVTGLEQVQVEAGNTAFTPLNFISYPYSHSLAAALFWSLLFGAVYYLLRKDGKSSLLLGVLVLSHWVLDLITHAPDLPLTPFTEEKYGLGLWNNKTATIIVELLIFSIAVYLYVTATHAINRAGRYTFWAFVIFMLLIYFMNAFGPPPPSGDAIELVGFSQWLLIAWGYWIDRNRNDMPAAEKAFLHHQIE